MKQEKSYKLFPFSSVSIQWPNQVPISRIWVAGWLLSDRATCVPSRVFAVMAAQVAVAETVGVIYLVKIRSLGQTAPVGMVAQCIRRDPSLSSFPFDPPSSAQLFSRLQDGYCASKLEEERAKSLVLMKFCCFMCE